MSNGTVTPPIVLTPCERAKQIYDKALEKFVLVLDRSNQNQGIQEYESGTRRVQYEDPDKARRSLEFAISLARTLCPTGDFPGPTDATSPALEEARYGIITDV